MYMDYIWKTVRRWSLLYFYVLGQAWRWFTFYALLFIKHVSICMCLSHDVLCSALGLWLFPLLFSSLLCYYCYLGKPVDVNNRRCATGRLLPSGFMVLCIYLLASMEWLRLYNEA
jgi:hypothetical protein